MTFVSLLFPFLRIQIHHSGANILAKRDERGGVILVENQLISPAFECLRDNTGQRMKTIHNNGKRVWICLSKREELGSSAFLKSAVAVLCGLG